MPDSEGISSQIRKIWSTLLTSLPAGLRDHLRKVLGIDDITDFVRILREARGPDEVLKILVDIIKAGDPKKALIAISAILRLVNLAWPEFAPVVSKLAMILRVLAESFEQAGQEGVGQ
jgi:hypothetical protein